MYSLACSYGMSVTDNELTVTVAGLDENIGKALAIVEDLILNAQGDEAVLASLKEDLLKQRSDNKLNMDACYSALEKYINYGPNYVKKVNLSNRGLSAATSDELLGSVKMLLNTCAHTILYYGPESEEDVKSLLADNHKVADSPVQLAKNISPRMVTETPQTYIVNYDARQFNYVQYSDRGEKYDPAEDAKLTLFNEYFGAGMNTIVFQEMRESRALAYSARARLTFPADEFDDYTFYAYIGSQNDKLAKAVTAFDEIINDMPQVDKNFDIAKASLDSKLRTTRVTGAAVLSSYLAARELGISEPREKGIFENLGALTMDDLVKTQEKWIKGRTYTYGIVGDTRDLDMNFLKSLGPVKVLSLEEVFGY